MKLLKVITLLLAIFFTSNVTSQIIFQEHFTNLTTVNYSTGITTANFDNSGWTSSLTSTGQSIADPGSLCIGKSGTAGGNLTTPSMDLSGTAPITLTFKLRYYGPNGITGSSTGNRVQVLYNSTGAVLFSGGSPNTNGIVNSPAGSASYTSTSWTSYTITLPPGGTSSSTITFQGAGSNYAYMIDDIVIERPDLTVSTGWLLSGNTVSTAKKLGTLDNVELPIVTNNKERIKVAADGNITFKSTYTNSGNSEEAFDRLSSNVAGDFILKGKYINPSNVASSFTSLNITQNGEITSTSMGWNPGLGERMGTINFYAAHYKASVGHNFLATGPTTKNYTLGLSNTLNGYKGFVVGRDNTTSGLYDSYLFGSNNIITQGQYQYAFGRDNQFINQSNGGFAVGRQNIFNHVYNTIVLGTYSNATNSIHSTLVGYKNTVGGGEENSVFGSYNTLTNGNENIVVGRQNTIGTGLRNFIFGEYNKGGNYTKVALIGRNQTADANSELKIGIQSDAYLKIKGNVDGTAFNYISTPNAVSIGIDAIPPADYKLAVKGNIIAEKLTVKPYPWSDFVFDSSYNLPKLIDVENYIKQNKHLQDVPSASEVERNGIEVGGNQAILLQKIEELTLYIIEQDKKNNKQEAAIADLEKQLAEIKKLLQK
ncbi:MAG: hypothetical protein V4556_08375 [Bacteroidota bacterium]